MNDEQIALACRAVACKGWRWLPGMLTACRVHVVEGGDGYLVGYRQGATRDGGGWVDAEDAGYLPDLTDPATLGCLLALVRGAWNDPDAHLAPSLAGWWVQSGSLRYAGTHDPLSGPAFTEAEALVAALEAAPAAGGVQ